MPLNGEGIVGAAGTVNILTKNDDPVRGYLIDYFTVLANDALLDGVCRIYKGFSANPDAQVAASGVGRQDTAEGPYYVPPGGTLLFAFAGLTPGVKAIVTYVGNPTSEPPLQQGKLTFLQPLTIDISPVPITVNQLLPNVVFVNPSRSGNVAGPGDETTSYFAPAGFVDQVLALQMAVAAVPGATVPEYHYLEVRQGPFPNIQILYGRQDANAQISYQFGGWYDAKIEGIPVENAWLLAQTLYATPTVPIVFYYNNGSNNTQTNDRIYWVTVLRREIPT